MHSLVPVRAGVGKPLMALGTPANATFARVACPGPAVLLRVAIGPSGLGCLFALLPSRLRLADGQAECELAPLAQLALDPDAASVGLHDQAGDVQPQPQPL